MAKKAKPPSSPVALRCVILAVDPGKKAGAAIVVSGGPKLQVHACAAVTAGDEPTIVQAATWLASELGLSLIVVREKWSAGGPHATPRMMAGLGARWGHWAAALKAAGHPDRRIVQVYSQTWKAKVLPYRFGMTGEQFTNFALARAKNIHGVDAPSGDAAVSLCIAEWASHAGEVEALLPKRRSV